MLRHRRSSGRISLSTDQHWAIDAAAKGLSPNSRHSFLLHVSQILRLSTTPPGTVTDQLLQRVIERALSEVNSP